MALFLGLFSVPISWSLPILIGYLIKGKYGTLVGLLSFTITYFLQEQFQYYWGLSFIWYNLSYSLGDIDWATSFYRYMGLNLVGFLIILLNAILAFFFLHFKSTKKKWIYPAGVLISIYLLGFSLSQLEVNSTIHQMKVAIFNPSTLEVNQVENNLRAQIDLLKSEIAKSEIKEVELIIGPEGYLSDLNSFPLFVDQLDSLGPIQELKSVCNYYNVQLLIGAELIHIQESGDFPSTTSKKTIDGKYYDIYNGSILIDGNQKTEWRSKQYLLPIAEEIPFHQMINHKWSPLPRIDNSYGTFKRNEPYKVNGKSIATAICYEGLYPQFIESIHEESELLIILSNDWTHNQHKIKQQEIYTGAMAKSYHLPTLLVTMNHRSVFLSETSSNQPVQMDGLQLITLDY